ncbi:MAG TPA: RICIN domain-containing protein [Actinocrinis sp.]|nr:RICIN domain-containing protein [Actinocrinis sp.]
MTSSALCVGAVNAAGASAAAQATLYVSPGGSGTACSSSAPCSLSQAKSTVESLVGSMSGDIVVYLAGGTYRLSSTFQLGPQDSGQNGHSVSWEAAAGQSPVISGGTQVTGWSQYNAGRNIWRASVPAGTQSRQLWVNGVEATRARSAMNPGGFSLSGSSFTTADSSYQAWANVAQTEIVTDNDWKEMRCPLSSITRTGSGGSSLNVNPTCFNANSTSVGFPFNGNSLPTMNAVTWIENNLALLTQPGQWYLDSGAGYLYYLPLQGQDMSSADVELPVVQELVALSGTPGHLTPINDTASAITYTGSGWTYSSGRPFGDYDNDVHSTTNNGDAVSYTFTGSGIEALTELSSDEGSVNVYVDGSLRQSVSAAASADRTAQQALVTVTGLAPGGHTVQLVKQSGTYMLLDGLVVIPTAIAPVHDITFSGITFEYTTWNAPTTAGYIDNQAGIEWSASNAWTPVKTPAALEVVRGSNINFTGDVVTDTGGTGVDFGDGTQNSTLSGSTITATAANGVNLGEADDYYQPSTTLMTLNDTISQNQITHNGTDYHDGIGVWAGYTRGAVISHNNVAYEPYGGINLGWGWGWQSSCSMQSAQGLSSCRHGADYAGGNQITNNSVSNVELWLRDNAFIYVLGGQGGGDGSLTSVISGNYGNGKGGVYPDEGSSWWQIQNNVWNLTSGDTSWTYIWTPTVNNITYGTNYSDVGGYTNNGTNVHFVQATVVGNGQWPAAAQSIIANAGAAPSGTSGGGGFPSGYVRLQIASNSLCLDGYGNSSAAGAIIDQWTCNGQANQQFQFVPTSGGYGELQIQNSGQDVTVLNGSTAQGQTDIVQEPVNGDTAGQWLPQQQSDGSWQFKNLGSGLCLDVYAAGSNTGQQLDQWPCKNAPGTNQDFNPR